ncbi:hypothetical protein [Klebsiella aerogenes]|uniref:Uncharacterized protein n=1 Tax=Klebsiella aerogenes TaxID=548 RepID=A0AAP9U7V0_KLEAE|nr:hypothetical protein [Klebsiella aerogenes]QMR42934.1 hypothetical protein HV331_25840 [Klebsiella aerogenes]
MSTLNIFYFLTGLFEHMAARVASCSLFAECLYWLHSDMRVLRRVTRRVSKAKRLEQFSSRPGTRALVDCVIARAAHILGYWQYHRPMNHVLVRAGMCDVNAAALRLAPDVWLNTLRDCWHSESELKAEYDAFLVSLYVDDERSVTEKA